MTSIESRTEDRFEAMACALEKHPGYRVIRRLSPKLAYRQPDGRPLRKGIVVDTETTGLRHGADRIVELGMVVFEFDPEDGQIYRILDTYNAFDDPGKPIPAQSIRVHGITDEMVAGKSIDVAHVERLLEGATIVIAHNAGFDRPFLEDRLPRFATLPWACSLTQVNWPGEGIGSAKLDYIAYQFGFFYEGHRAQADCLALLEALQHPLPVSGGKGLKRILEAFDATEYRIWARGAAFETRERLKARSYRWGADERCWYKTVGHADMEVELDWLREAVYGGCNVNVDLDVVDAGNRFSKRPAKRVGKTI